MAGLNYVTFNQDHSLLAVATTRGLRVFNTDPFEITTKSYEEDITLVEQLFSTSLVAMILTPRLLRIVNTKVGYENFLSELIRQDGVERGADADSRRQRNSIICELTFHGMVVAVKMNRKRLVVMLEEVAFIYDISNMKMIHQKNTPLNPAGICAISPNSEYNFLAIPHYHKTANPPLSQPSHVPKLPTKESISGDVLLYDLNKMEEVAVIQAHQTPVSFIAINNEGRLMATASEKGTVIRVFALPSGRKLYQFRRGSMPARIYSMSFNATSTLLCVSSATETVHVFKLAAPGTIITSSNPAAAAHHNPRPQSPPLSPHKSSAFPGSDSRSNSPSPSDPASEPDADLAAFSSPSRQQQQQQQPRQAGFMSLVRRTSQTVSTSLVSRAAGYLPSSVTEIWEPQRDFAWVRVPRGGGGGGGGGGSGGSGAVARNVVAMANNAPHVMVATSEGDFYVYSIDLQNGGEGTLVRRFEAIHYSKKYRRWSDSNPSD